MPSACTGRALANAHVAESPPAVSTTAQRPSRCREGNRHNGSLLSRPTWCCCGQGPAGLSPCRPGTAIGYGSCAGAPAVCGPWFQGGLGGLCLGQAVGSQAVGLPCPTSDLGARFVLRGRVVGARGTLTAEPSSVCAQMGLGRVRTPTRTSPPPPTTSLCLSLSPAVSECCA